MTMSAALQKNTWWLHFRGGVYQLLGVAQDANFDWRTVEVLPEEEQAKAAIKGNIALYKGADGIVWARPLEEFLGNHSSGQKRFMLLIDKPGVSYDEARLEANRVIAGMPNAGKKEE